MLVTIHQPDLMPWLGFFNKINNSDIWVILDHVKNNPRDSAFWGRRVKIMQNGEGKWLSFPLKSPAQSGLIGISINEMEYNINEQKIYLKSLQIIELNYKNAPFFNEIYPIVKSFIISNEINMAKRNLNFIFQIMDLLDIKKNIVYSSDLNCKLNSTELLIEIINKINGKEYLCGGGANGYQNNNLFLNAGINIKYNNFIHPVYNQLGSSQFISGLSILDVIMNIGIVATKKLL
jgi:hypothetical protein